MGIVLTLILGRIIRNHGRLDLDVAVFRRFLFYIIVGVVFVAIAAIKNTPGALFASLVYVIWPLVYAFLVEACADTQRLVNLLRVMIIAMLGIGIGTLYYFAWALGWVPDSLYIDLGLVDRVAFLGVAVQMVHYSVACLIFLIPFTLAALFVYTPERPSFISQWVLWLGLALGLFSAAVAGRRVVFLVLLATPPLFLYFRNWLPPLLRSGKTRQIILVLCLGATVFGLGSALGSFTQWSWSGTQELFLEGFQFQTNEDAAPRSEQLHALLQGWEANPLIGAGLGAPARGVIRNSDRPWEYELQYPLLLFQTGAIGFLIYASGIAWIYIKGRKIVRSGTPIGVHLVPVFVGTTCFLIANAADPYLQTFGQLWTLFLPVAMINSALLSEKRAAGLSPSRHFQASGLGPRHFSFPSLQEQ